jgi:hypothetical protein
MREEIDIGGGVLIPGLMLWAILALLLSLPVRLLLSQTGFYRFVWHRGLFDICLFIIVWGAMAAIGTRWP